MLLIGGITLLCGVCLVRDGMIMVFKAFVLGVVSEVERKGILICCALIFFDVSLLCRSSLLSYWVHYSMYRS